MQTWHEVVAAGVSLTCQEICYVLRSPTGQHPSASISTSFSVQMPSALLRLALPLELARGLHQMRTLSAPHNIPGSHSHGMSGA